MVKKINIAYLAAEAVPFVKVGGLADVAGSLPKSILSLNEEPYRDIDYDLRVVLPLHHSGDSHNLKLERISSYDILEGTRKTEITAFKSIMNGVITYFLDWSFLNDHQEVYSTIPEVEQEKYLIFSIAVMNLFKLIRWRVDVLHANDWHTALCMNLLNSQKYQGYYINTSAILSIHNLAYMGGHCRRLLAEYKISYNTDPDMPEWAIDQPLPIGLISADKIAPVSETYASEIQTTEYGCGLNKYLSKNKNKITGIINGLDTGYWNPLTDSLINSNYDINHLDNRKNNKIYLQKILHLKIQENLPLIGMVTRINQQKGIDLALKVLSSIAKKGWQLVILGTGDPSLELDILNFQREFPEKIVFVNSYDEKFAHQIYAGADIFFMPSRYEPCGLSQMIANRYGCIPVVTGVGGLKDTIVDNINGFVANKVKLSSIKKSLKKSIVTFKNIDEWQKIEINAMRKDFSWGKSAMKYTDLYRNTRKNRGEL